jgi:hypothetical protein
LLHAWKACRSKEDDRHAAMFSALMLVIMIHELFNAVRFAFSNSPIPPRFGGVQSVQETRLCMQGYVCAFDVRKH